MSKIADLSVVLPEDRVAMLSHAAALAQMHLTQIADEVTAELAARVPDYEVFPGTRDENRWIIGLFVAELRTCQPHGVKERELIRQRAYRWAQDTALDTVIEGFHVGLRSVVRIVGELARLDEIAMVALQDHAWTFAMHNCTVVAEVQRDLAVAAAQHDVVRRTAFLRDLATGRVTAGRLAVDAEALGVDTDHEYYAVRASGADRELATLETHLCFTGGTRARKALSTVGDGQLIAIAARRPDVPVGTTVALGSPRRPGDIHRSFTEAGDVLNAAQAFGITGAVDLIALGPLTLATVGDHLARRLAQHYLGDRDEAFADIAETVRTLLDNDLGIDDTAAALHLHRNTVRYRVQRFRELTGLDIRRTHDLVTIWWLLKWSVLNHCCPLGASRAEAVTS